jgi:hypothetical protein
MTAASRGPDLFSIFSESNDLLYRTRPEPFLYSVLGQAAILLIITYFTGCIVAHPPDGVHPLSNFSDRFLIFAGHNGGGGGDLDVLLASHGNLPRASLATQIAPPAVILSKEMPKVPAEPTVVVAPEIKFPEGVQLGDPASEITRWLSSGSGRPRRDWPGVLRGSRSIPRTGSWSRAVGNLSGRQDGSHGAGSHLQSGTEFLRGGPQGEGAGSCSALASRRQGWPPL